MKSQTDLTSSESQSGAVELAIENPAIGSATINIGEEATLKVTLTNNGDPVTLTKDDASIEFNVPSFIDLDQVKIEELSAPWMEGDKNPAQNSFTILCNNNGTWANGSTITFNLTQIDAVGTEASTGNFTAFSTDVLDYNTLSVPVILNAQDSPAAPINFSGVLGVTLNNGGTIFVNDPPLLNQLTLNFKNLVSDRPIFNGTTWPSTANPQVYISFIWGAGSGALTSLDTLNTQPVSLSPYETTSDWDPDKGTSNELPIWTLSPPKDPQDTGTDSNILGTGDQANATFQFNDIAPIVNGATQMYVQVTGFPYDDDNLYENFTFLVPITKTNPPVKGIPYFSAADTPLNAIPGQPLLANFFWQVFDIPQVQLTATTLGLDWKSEVYTEVLVTDNHEVDLSQFYGAPSILFNLYGLNGSGNRINGIANQTIVEITYPLPVINSFSAYWQNNKLWLSWDTDGDHVRIYPISSPQYKEGKIEIYPAYSPLQNSYTLTAINPNGKEVSMTIESTSLSLVSSTPNMTGYNVNFGNVVVSPDGNQIYALGGFGMTVFDAYSLEVLQSIVFDNEPFGIAVSPDSSKVYISLDGYPGSVLCYNTRLKPMTKFAGDIGNLGGSPRSIALSPEGDYLYVGNYGDGTLWKLDAVSLAKIDSTELGNSARPDSIKLSPNGDLIYIGGEGAPELIVLNTLTLQPISESPGNSGYANCVAISPDGTRAFAANYNEKTMTVLDTETLEQITNNSPVDVGGRACSLAASPDGRRVYVANYDLTGMIQVFDAMTLQLIGTPITAYSRTYCVAVSPDGDHIYITAQTTGNDKVMLYRPDTFIEV